MDLWSRCQIVAPETCNVSNNTDVPTDTDAPTDSPSNADGETNMAPDTSSNSDGSHSTNNKPISKFIIHFISTLKCR